jgi:hypothetical protein
MSRALSPPSGWPAPGDVTLAGAHVQLAPLAGEIADRYFREFPDDLERYGEAARAWEVHDTSHCLQWAVLDAEGLVDLRREVDWLAKVLHARGFPLDRLARNLELGADVVAEQLGEPGRSVAQRLRSAAGAVRGEPTPPRG